MFTHTLAVIPDLHALHAHSPALFPTLLQSVAHQGWDILFALPRHTRLFQQHEGRELVAALAALPVVADAAPLDTPLPFTGGWVFYLAYEVLHQFEPTVPAPHTDAFPLAALARIPAAILVDREQQQAYAVAETEAELQQLLQTLSSAPAWQAPALTMTALSEDPPQAFVEGVVKVQRYIREGDVFQVNLSRQWQATLAPQQQAIDVFAALRHANPAPFSALWQFNPQQAIVSSSPERLVRVRQGWADTRPIAGTHPRSSDPEQDAALKANMIGSLKERAEHVMLIDLERNDLGRICVPGTVEVDELMTVASYPFVHHIESNIRGRLQANINVLQLFRALFPGGTITGCPKVRCMQIIRELETTARGAYTGSLGYLNHDGRLDSNILIRTFMMEGHHLRFRAGAGIVADSDPERELQETRHKARGLLRALGVDGQDGGVLVK